MPKFKQVALFVPCFIDQFYPNVAFNMIKVLEALGCSVVFNPKQTCCGQPAYNSGYQKEACTIAKKFLADFDNPDYYIVAPSASCVGMVKNHYQHLMPENQQVEQVSKRIFEFTEFIVDILKVEKIPNATFAARAAYHDSCSALRELGIKSAPRTLLRNVSGLELIEMEDTNMCCGFGGTFAVKYEAISVAMAAQKVERAMEKKAQYLISTDSSCLMHIQAVIYNNTSSLKTIHIAEILASGW